MLCGGGGETPPPPPHTHNVIHHTPSELWSPAHPGERGGMFPPFPHGFKGRHFPSESLGRKKNDTYKR